MSMEHLLLHWFIVAPLVRWITHPGRPWSQKKGVWLAILALLVISSIEIQRTKANFYEILGVDEKTDKTTINMKYRKLAVSLHPDRNKAADAEEQFIRLKQAHEVLTNPSKKRMYRKFGDYEKKIHSEAFPQIICMSIVNYVVSFIFGVFMTTSPEHKEGRQWIYCFVVFACAAELYMRFTQGNLFTWVPFFGSWLEFEKIQAFQKLFPAVLSGAMLISASVHRDHHLEVQRLLREVCFSNGHTIDLFRHLNKKAEAAGMRVGAVPEFVPQSAAVRVTESMGGMRQALRMRGETSSSQKVSTVPQSFNEEAIDATFDDSGPVWNMATRTFGSITKFLVMAQMGKMFFDTFAKSR